LLLLVVKAAVLFMAARAFGVAAAAAAEVALLLPQAGEFGLVVFGVAATSRLISSETVQFLNATIALTMIATPALAYAARGLGKRLERKKALASHELPDDDGLTDHVIIGGYGRVGRTIARLLQAENVPYLALDMNANLVGEHSKAGHPVYFGDASRVEFLRRAGAKRARAFVVTLDEPDAAERMIQTIRKLREDAVVLARAVDRPSARKLMQLGAIEVVPETFEASLQLGGRVLEVLGASEDAVAYRLASVRDQLEQEIKADPQEQAER